MTKRILSLLLAGLMLIASMASCASGERNEETTLQPNSTDTVEESNTQETLDVPNVRYNDKTLSFLTRDEAEWTTLEIFAENQTAKSDNISTAVFERNDRIFQNYGVTITEIKKGTDQHQNILTKEVSAPNGDFQAVITNTVHSGKFATNGLLWNLNSDEIEYMNFEKPWWDTNMAQGMSIDNRLYFATGDLLISDNDATFVLLFNKSIALDCQLPDLYAMVENGTWTMDSFYEFEQMAVQDNNGNAKLDYDTDVCGFAFTGDVPYCMLFGGGVTMCQKDEADIPVYQLNVELAQNIAEKGKLIFSKDHTIDMNAVVNSSGIPIYDIGNKTFGEGHALFMGEVMQCVTRLRSTDANFGILPYPKYNTEQTDYYSMMHLTASCVSIPRSIKGDELVMVNSMIEAMAYHSVDTLTTQYYEINLKTKGAKDEQSGPMIDRILSTRVCDLSYYYQWGTNAFGSLANCLLPTGSKGGVASQNKRFKSSIERSIGQLLKSMEKLDS